MLFNSLDFAIYLPVVFLLYWFVTKSLRAQNLLIVGASYVFYGWWDYRFLALILFSTLVDYAIGRSLMYAVRPARRKALLWTSILVNLGFLGFFKYFNFFLTSFVDAFSLFGRTVPATSLDIILPVGISFYTFQTLSYTIDVYRRKLDATTDFVSFAAFVSFFPQLVAGPIERATHLLPQFYRSRTFDYRSAVDGMRQILWGLVKKIVIADNCAELANMIFNNSSDYSGSTLLLGAFFFTFQIYGDFSGYSDIAIGTSRLFGFDLMQNFRYPYFSRDIAEFWRRWHISLSTWFRDYLYIPLGGSRGGTAMRIRNTFIIFLVSGFWHGANWTFVVWGFLNALYFLPLILSGHNRDNLGVVAPGRWLPTWRDALAMGVTFSLTVLAWIFFRAENLSHAFSYLNTIFSLSTFTAPSFPRLLQALYTLPLIVGFLVVEWVGREQAFAIAHLGRLNHRPVQWMAYTTLILTIYFFGHSGDAVEFIYFQF